MRTEVFKSELESSNNGTMNKYVHKESEACNMKRLTIVLPPLSKHNGGNTLLFMNFGTSCRTSALSQGSNL